jgi:hypothetical protein
MIWELPKKPPVVKDYTWRVAECYAWLPVKVSTFMNNRSFLVWLEPLLVLEEYRTKGWHRFFYFGGGSIRCFRYCRPELEQAVQLHNAKL